MHLHFRTLILFCIAISSATFPCSAIGEQFYLAPNGDNTNGDGSSSYPWATINHAIGKMSQSDDLILKDGTYPISAAQIIPTEITMPGEQSVPSGGTSLDPMVIEAANSGMVKIDASEMNQLWASAISIKAPWVTFKGIDVAYNAYGSGITGYADSIIIDDCNSHTHGIAGIRITAGQEVTQWNDVPKNCVIKNCGVWNTCLRNKPGYFLFKPEWREANGGWPNALSVLRAQNAKIQNCYSGFNFGEGIALSRVRGGDSEIRNCTAVDNFSVNIYVDSVSGADDLYVEIKHNIARTDYSEWSHLFLRYNEPAINYLLATENYDIVDALGSNDCHYLHIRDNLANDGAYNFKIANFGPTAPAYVVINGNTSGAFAWEGYSDDTNDINGEFIWLGANTGF